jgi:hypothetical protein
MRVSFSLEYSIRRVKVNMDGLKLNCTHQFLVYANDVNILGWSGHTIKKKAEALIYASKQTGLEVNADKTKYMTISRDQSAGWIRNIKIYYSTFKGLRMKTFEETPNE